MTTAVLLFVTLLGLFILFRRYLQAPTAQTHVDRDGNELKIMAPSRRAYGAGDAPASAADTGAHCGPDGGCGH